MKINDLNPGKYVLAISGGVDSMVLLDILQRRPAIKLVLGHFNHGIRPDSHKDELLVKKTAAKYGLALQVGHGYLGENTSEELAREKRYQFLYGVAQKHRAVGVITAHHQDDLIETAFLNILRGTSYRGLTAIYLNPKIYRPLINVPKDEIIKYAKTKNLKWREDSTNQNTKYLRNYIRINVMPGLSGQNRQEIIKIIEKVAKKQRMIEAKLATMSHKELKKIDRAQYVSLPSDVGTELVAHWLRKQGQTDYDKKTLERLYIALRTANPGTKHEIKNKIWLKVDSGSAQLTKTL